MCDCIYGSGAEPAANMPCSQSAAHPRHAGRFVIQPRPAAKLRRAAGGPAVLGASRPQPTIEEDERGGIIPAQELVAQEVALLPGRLFIVV